MSVIPDKFLIKEKFNIPGGGYIEIHDSRYLPTFLEINTKLEKLKETLEKYNFSVIFYKTRGCGSLPSS